MEKMSYLNPDSKHLPPDLINKLLSHNINQPILESYKDDEGNYHAENYPAIITEDNVYFLNHGKDWDDQKYENYIREKAANLYSDENTAQYTFSQMESIILTTLGWGSRKKLRNPIKLAWATNKSATDRIILTSLHDIIEDSEQ